MSKNLAQEAGYQVELGGLDDGPLQGKYWWTLTRPGWSGIEASPAEFETEAAAWDDAVRAFQEELANGTLGPITSEEIDKLCDRLLDSAEHAGEAAIPEVAEDAVAVLRRVSAELAQIEAEKQDLASQHDAVRGPMASANQVIQEEISALYRGDIDSEQAVTRISTGISKQALAEFLVDAFNRGWVTIGNLGINEEGTII